MFQSRLRLFSSAKKAVCMSNSTIPISSQVAVQATCIALNACFIIVIVFFWFYGVCVKRASLGAFRLVLLACVVSFCIFRIAWWSMLLATTSAAGGFFMSDSFYVEVSGNLLMMWIILIMLFFWSSVVHETCESCKGKEACWTVSFFCVLCLMSLFFVAFLVVNQFYCRSGVLSGSSCRVFSFVSYSVLAVLMCVLTLMLAVYAIVLAYLLRTRTHASPPAGIVLLVVCSVVLCCAFIVKCVLLVDRLLTTGTFGGIVRYVAEFVFPDFFVCLSVCLLIFYSIAASAGPSLARRYSNDQPLLDVSDRVPAAYKI